VPGVVARLRLGLMLMTGNGAEGMVEGRERELALLNGLLEAAASGRPRFAVVRGPSGIGKSALVDAFLAGHPGLAMRCGSGAAWETECDGGVLRQLLGPGDADRDPSTREAAASGCAAGERLLAAFRAHPDRAGVVLVEDLQWVDEVTLRALLFAVRRLADQRLLVLVTVGDEESHLLPAGARELHNGGRGTVVAVGPLDGTAVRALALKHVGVELSAATAHRLAGHTGGNPRHVLGLLREFPPETWTRWQPELPAPAALSETAGARLAGAGGGARALAEAAAVLGLTSRLADAAALAGIGDPLGPLEEAVDAGLLRVGGGSGSLSLAFASPVDRAAVYHHMPVSRRVELHLAAAQRIENPGQKLRHRAAACILPDASLAAELEDHAACQAESGAWQNAADALYTAGRLFPTTEGRETRLLRAIDAMVAAGELPRALAHADELGAFAPSALRDAVSGYIAILQGRSGVAEAKLASAWDASSAGDGPDIRATIAQRRVLHALSRIDGPELVHWVDQAGALADPESPAFIESQAIRGLGLGAMGRIAEAEACYAALNERRDLGAQAQRVRMGMGWLHVATDRHESAREELAAAVSTDFSDGSYRISLWARAWLARAEFGVGRWDQALRTAREAVVLQERVGMELVRPLLHWTLTQIHAMRGEWDAAAEHLERGRATAENYPIMLVPGRLAMANAAEARTDYDAVILALEPLLSLDRTAGLDEPGFWPWQDVYANALVMKDRVDEASAFLRPLEVLAAERGHRSGIARMAYVRGRIHGAEGNTDAARAAFEAGRAQLAGLHLPYDRARVDFAYGQTMRRAGKRREAAAVLTAARADFAALGAATYVERCERELQAAGTSVSRRDAADLRVLTPQERAVARLVAGGASNKQAAEELYISVKTVQYHLTHAYEKLGVGSRGELAARYRDAGRAD
jgi:DNA-binding CsgD family transcriptional regulator